MAILIHFSDKLNTESNINLKESQFRIKLKKKIKLLE